MYDVIKVIGFDLAVFRDKKNETYIQKCLHYVHFYIMTMMMISFSTQFTQNNNQ